MAIMAGEEDEEKRIMLRGMISVLNKELPYALMSYPDEKISELWFGIESVWNFDEARLFAEEIVTENLFWRWANLQFD